MSVLGFMLMVLAACLWPGNSRFINDPSTSIRREDLRVNVCPECRQIIQLSGNMISTTDTKVTLYESLHALCHRLPEQASECDTQVKTYLPKVLLQTPGYLKPEEICMVFGLCASYEKEEGPLKLSDPTIDESLSSSALSTATKTQELFSPICTLCLFLMRKIETLLPKNMTEDALMKLMEEVCDLVPKSYKDQCDDFVSKYGAEIVEFLLSSAAPHTICTLLHLCLFGEQTVQEVPLLPLSDCESCRTLAALSRLHLGINATEHQTSAFLQSVCLYHPNAIPKCDSFTRIYGSRLQKVLGNQMDLPHVCERADMCISKVEPFRKVPCIWGPSYWCKDLKTAQKCGNQTFCKKYMWKK